MPENQPVRSRVHPDETYAAEMDELVAEAIGEAAADAGRRTITDDAADWLDDIDAVLESVDVALVPYRQKSGQ